MSEDRNNYIPALRYEWLLNFFSKVGLQDGQETARYATMFGTVALYQARKPADD